MTFKEYELPVSVKGVINQNDRLILLKNDRSEWELPGGRLEDGETPESCLIREVQEELSVSIVVDELMDAWIYRVVGKQILILVYQGRLLQQNQDLIISDEHHDVGLFRQDQLAELNLPDGYRGSIAKSELGQQASLRMSV